MATNPFDFGGGSSGAGGSSSGGNPFDFGGTSSRGAAVSRSLGAKAAKPKGGLGGLVSNLGHLISPGALSSGLFGMGKGLVEEALVNPAKAFVHGDVLSGVEHMGLNPIGLAHGAIQGAVTGKESDIAPFSSMFGASMRRTGEDFYSVVPGGPPNAYAEAYHQGQLVSKLVEDAANVSIVGGVAAKGLNLASAGHFAEAAGARSEAIAAVDAVKTAEGALAKAEERAAAATKAAEKVGAEMDAAKGNQPLFKQLRTRYNQVAGNARDRIELDGEASSPGVNRAQTVLTERRAEAAAAQARADASLTQSGLAYRSYNAMRSISHLGGEGAMLPAKPYALAGRALSAGTKMLLGQFPKLKEAIDRAAELTGMTDAARRLSQMNRRGEAILEGRSLAVARAYDRAAKVLGPDADAYLQLAQEDLSGKAKAIADVHAGVGGLGGKYAEALPGLVAETARSLGVSPEVAEMALRAARGELTPAELAKVQAAQKIMTEEIFPQFRTMEETGPGRKRNPSEPQREYAQWNVSGTGLAPGALRDLEARKAAQTTARTEAVGAAQAKVAKVGEKVGARPGETVRQFVTRQAREEAMAATGRGARGSLADVLRAERAKGSGATALRAAATLRKLRDEIPATVPDEAVMALSDAAERLGAATRALDAARVPGQAIDVAASQPEILNLRAEALSLARAQLGALPELPSSLPYLPSDLSEHYQYLNEQVGAPETNLRRDVAMMREKLKGRARFTTSEADLWVRAYNKFWKALPADAKAVLTKLDEAEVRRLAGTRIASEYAGLDEHASIWAGPQGPEGEAAIRGMLDDYARQAQLTSFVERADKGMRGGKGGWTYGDIAALSRLIPDGEVVRLLEDPAMRRALVAGKLSDVAQQLAARRAADAAPVTEAPIPDPTALRAATQSMDILDDADALAALERAFGEGPDGVKINEFHRRWTAAGEPDLSGTLTQLEAGTAPEWLSAAPDTGAPGLDTLRAQEQARGDIAGVMGEAGGQAVRGQLGAEASRFTGQATQAAKTAAGAEQATGEMFQKAAAPAVRAGIQIGEDVAKYRKSLDALRITEKQLAKMPDWYASEMDKLYKDFRNAPARARPPLIYAQTFAQNLVKWRGEMLDSGVLSADDPMLPKFDALVRDSVRDIRDIWGGREFLAGPGGEVTALPGKFDPVYVPGGQPFGETGAELPPAPGGPSTRPMATRLSPGEKRKATAKMPRTMPEFKAVLRQRLVTEVRNNVVRGVVNDFAKFSHEILGDLPDNVTPEAVYAAMREQHYTPWDPESSVAGAGLAPDIAAKDVHAGTLWLSDDLYRGVKGYWSKTGPFETFMRKYYDKPMTFWRASVLALRPAWHIANMTGNALLGMIAGGMDPITWAKRMRQARAVMKLETLGPEAGAAKFAGLRARAATIEPGTLAEIGNAEGAGVAQAGNLRISGLPPDIRQRQSGASLAQPWETDPLAAEVKRTGIKGVLQKAGMKGQALIDASYRANGFVDDMNRMAVFLERRAKMSGTDLFRFAAQHPELGGLSLEQLRTEAAVRLSLKAAGDFVRMNPLERQVIRRIVPFYGWLRFSTQMSMRLALFHPARVAWMLHLAELYGDPNMDFGLTNALVLGPNSLLQFPNVNPFQDAAALTGAGSGSIGSEIGFGLTPALKVPIGIATGIDVNRMTQFQRPPGQPGGYGGLITSTDLLGRPGELAHLLANQFPQSRLAQGLYDTLKYGGPAMHYPLGQVRRRAGKPIKTGDPFFGPLARYIGVPFPRKPNVYERPQVRQVVRGK